MTLLKVGDWKLVISDTGPYSDKSLEFCARQPIFPLIRARSDIVEQPTRELKKGYWFRTDYIPAGWSDADVLTAVSSPGAW